MVTHQRGTRGPDSKISDSDESSKSDVIDEREPQPISSDSEEDFEKPSPYNGGVPQTQGSSRLYSPYQTLGVVSSGVPFHYLPHQSSESSMICIPIGKRFQLVGTNKLDPLMVSHSVEHKIEAVVADASLSISIVAHKNHLTLFNRTMSVASKQNYGRLISLLHLGHTKIEMRGEKKGKMENALIVAAVYATPDEEDDGVSIEGESDDDESDDGLQWETKPVVQILVATRETLQTQSIFDLRSIDEDFQPCLAMHPSTYVNKIVVAGHIKGKYSMQLLNIRSRKVIHTFSCLPQNQPLTAIEQSPAVDTVAVGTATGKVLLVNLRHDQLLFTLEHMHKSAKKTVSITSLSFRTDSSAVQYGIAPMAVGKDDGSITVWDLQESESNGRTILTELETAHAGGVSHVYYLPQEPLLLSIGATSNSLLLHIFDNPDHSARLLRFRRGHSSPSNMIRYLHASGSGIRPMDGTDAQACQILSGGGQDRSLRVFSTARTVLDKEYSQGRGIAKKAKRLKVEESELKSPPIEEVAVSQVRSRDWGNVVTRHTNHSFCYVWSSLQGAQSGPILRQPNWNVSSRRQPPPPDTNATAVCISTCGHFCLVGTRGGVIYKYNIQSGHPRGSYPKKFTELHEKKKGHRIAGDVNRTLKSLEKKMKLNFRAANLEKEKKEAERSAVTTAVFEEKIKRASHIGYAVTGIAVDSINKTVLTVGRDSKLVLWHFVTHAPHKASPYQLPGPATKLAHVKESNLAAIALEDYSTLLFDCAALTVVRRFGKGNGHVGPITDLGFTPDGRSLLTSSLDSTIRVWDVPTNTCVDWLSFEKAPTSLTVSPTGEFLATTHQGQLGISVWSDHTFYRTVHMDISPQMQASRMDEPLPMAEKIPVVSMNSRFGSSEMNRSEYDAANEETDQKVYVLPKVEGLITLSDLPTSHWKNLFHLELVKERNKPKEAPKKPPSAPFFLQWRAGEAIEDNKEIVQAKGDNNEWTAAWSDEEGDNADASEESVAVESEKRDGSELVAHSSKRQKIGYHRSVLATLLEECSQQGTGGYDEVTSHVGQLGPSAIDVELGSLCFGGHDLEEGLPLLEYACCWLLDAIRSRKGYEVINAYIHRFLYVHATVFSGIDGELHRTGDAENGFKSDYVALARLLAELRDAQQRANDQLQGKMENALCLLRHFSRMI